MKRLLPSLVGVLMAGALATACTITPQAANVNGTTISTRSFNSQLQALDTTQAGQCLLEAETGQAIQTQGSGGQGTFDMGFADSILQNSVSNTLAAQLAASKGLTVTTADLATARTDFEALLSGEITTATQASTQSESASYCVSSAGTALTAEAVLGALPASLGAELVNNNAVDELLLSDGADITDAQIEAYYAANQPLFTTACISGILTDTQAHADQYLAQLAGGASFGDVAKANSLDPTSAAQAGALGCTFTLSQIEQELNLSSVAVGKPIGPIEDSSSGGWELYQVTSATVIPLADATADIRRQLLQSTTNGNRVSEEIVAFARHSDVYVDPQYGTWEGHVLVAPTVPPLGQLLAAASGASAKSLALGNGSGSTGSTASTGGSIPSASSGS